MTSRERFSAVLKGQRPDRMAWLADLSYWHAAHTAIGDLPERWHGPAGRHEMHRELGVGEYIPGCDACETSEGPEVQRLLREDAGRREIVWRTPVGELREVQEYSAPSFSWGYTEHAVKTPADLRVLRYIIAQRRYRACPERFLELDRGYAACGFGPGHVAAPATPLSELNKHWVGVMDLCFLMADAPEEVAATLAVIAAAHDEIYRLIAASPCWHVMICENLSAETMGGYFDRYLAPHLRRWNGWLHEAGKAVLLHNDGTLRGTLEKLAGAGVDAVDSVTPRPVGDAGLEEIRGMAGDRIVLLGGLPGALFAPPYTARDMEKQVLEIIGRHKDGGKFIVASADQVPPNGDLALVQLVGELLDQHGRY